MVSSQIFSFNFKFPLCLGRIIFKCILNVVSKRWVWFLWFFLFFPKSFPKITLSTGLFICNNFRKEASNRSESVRCLFRKLKIFICLGDSGSLLNALLP